MRPSSSLRNVAASLSALLTYDEVRLLATLLRNRTGVFLDVGAHRGASAGQFLRTGWEVYAFEPDPTNRAVLEQLLDQPSGNLTIVPLAASDIDGEKRQFFVSDLSSGISSLHRFHPSHQALKTTVETIRLDSFIVREGISRYVLKVDVEGHELPVLRGLDLTTSGPDAAIIEFDLQKNVPDAPDPCEIARILEGAGYHCAASEWYPIKEYGQVHRPRRIVDASEVADHAWGNVIAFRSPELLSQFTRVARRQIAKARVFGPLHRVLTRAYHALQSA